MVAHAFRAGATKGAGLARLTGCRGAGARAGLRPSTRRRSINVVAVKTIVSEHGPLGGRPSAGCGGGAQVSLVVVGLSCSRCAWRHRERAAGGVRVALMSSPRRQRVREGAAREARRARHRHRNGGAARGRTLYDPARARGGQRGATHAGHAGRHEPALVGAMPALPSAARADSSGADRAAVLGLRLLRSSRGLRGRA